MLTADAAAVLPLRCRSIADVCAFQHRTLSKELESHGITLVPTENLVDKVGVLITIRCHGPFCDAGMITSVLSSPKFTIHRSGACSFDEHAVTCLMVCAVQLRMCYAHVVRFLTPF